MQNAPVGIITDILELRGYANMKQAIDHAQRDDDIPDSPLRDVVWDIQAELIKERRAEADGRRKK